MNKTQHKKQNNVEKRTYLKPTIERVKMDYNISLVMMTDPPGDAEKFTGPSVSSNNPFKM